MLPQPTQTQARIIWLALSAIAVAVILASVVGAFWVLGVIAQKLSVILLPLAVAGILAYLLDPLVDAFGRIGVPRTRAIWLVFFLGVMLILGMLGTVVPALVVETQDLINQFPDLAKQVEGRVRDFMASSPWGEKARQAWESDVGAKVQAWLEEVLPTISAWLLAQLGKIASWFGLLVGFAMVPVFLFYFLLEKRGIESHWTNYLPIQESKIKNEVVFILTAINDYLILFFRGQVLVALCDGVLLTIGFLAIGIKYAFLLGMTAGLLSIVPFLGVAISLIPALALAAVQYGDWLHPLMVLALFAAVQMLEGLYISPKIMGDKVGLHPLTIIIAVMIGTALLGGITGGILAIPLTAALRVLMFRYVWRQPAKPKTKKG